MRVKSISKASVLRKNTNYIFCVSKLYNYPLAFGKSISKASVLRKNTNYIFCVSKLYNYPLAFGAGRPALTFGFLASKKSSIEIPSHS